MLNFSTTEVFEIVKKISLINESRSNPANPVLVAIDGPAGSGKTTLATQIADQLAQTSIIHMDDLYNGWDDALTPTLTTHLQNWILEPLSGKQSLQYQKFNWASNQYDTWVEVKDFQLLLLEGVGAAQSVVRSDAALTIWIEVGPQIGLERVLNRDGAQILPYMLKWQERESAHFLRDQTKINCEIYIDSSNT